MEKEKIDKKKPVLFITDDSVLVKMFEGNNDKCSVDLLNQLSRAKAKGLPCRAVVTLASFLRALWEANPDNSIKNVQTAMETFEIIPTKELDYKNKEKVKNDLIKLAQSMSSKKK